MSLQSSTKGGLFGKSSMRRCNAYAAQVCSRMALLIGNTTTSCTIGTSSTISKTNRLLHAWNLRVYEHFIANATRLLKRSVKYSLIWKHLLMLQIWMNNESRFPPPGHPAPISGD